MAARKSAKSLGFEEGMERLELIARQMEQNELPLEELLALYEEGVKLSGELGRKLDEAQGRMQEVRAGGQGEPVAVPVDMVHQESLLDGNGGEA